MKPPRRAERPNLISTASYWREGKRHVRAALRLFPDLSLPNALIHYLQNGGPLTSATVLRYAEDCRRWLRVWQRRHRLGPVWFEQMYAAVQQALESRRINRRRKRGEKAIPRLATATEFDLLMQELLTRYRKSGDVTPIVAGFAVLAIQATGMRPVEMMDAKVQGEKFVIRNAKHKSGQAEYRSLDLTSRSPQLPRAMQIFLAMVQIGVQSRHEFDRFRDRLAECVARACERAKLPRYSLYSFRHLAMAIWTEQGLPAEIIAALAGHFSSLTAARNYARGTSNGWDPETTLMGKLAENISLEAVDETASTTAEKEAEAPQVRQFKFPIVYRQPVPGAAKKAPISTDIKYPVRTSSPKKDEATAPDPKPITRPTYKGGITTLRETENPDVRRGPALWEAYRQRLDNNFASLPANRFSNGQVPNPQADENRERGTDFTPGLKK